MEIQQALNDIRTRSEAHHSTPQESTKAELCAICQGTGFVSVSDGVVRRCECKKRAIAEDRIRVILQDWPEYSDVTLEGYRPKPGNVAQQNAITALRQNPKGNYFLSGYFSRGKTHLMIAQYRYLALAGDKCVLRSARDLMEEIRKAELPPQPNQEQFVSPVLQLVNLAPAGHVFIDDLEKASARSEFRAEMLFDLLDTIKRRQLGITVTSNLPLKQLAPKIGDAATARLYRLCTEIEL